MKSHDGYAGNIYADVLAYQGSELWRRNHLPLNKSFQERPKRLEPSLNAVDHSHVLLPEVPGKVRVSYRFKDLANAYESTVASIAKLNEISNLV